MDKSSQERCAREYTQSFKSQTWKTCRNDPNDILSAGARAIAYLSRRVQRNDDGLSGRVDRLKALGNAVVSQQVLPIFKAITSIEEVQS